MSATLKYRDNTLSEASIDFWIGDQRVCSGVLTDAHGRATCMAPYPAGASTYRAIFNGMGAFQPSEATGQLAGAAPGRQDVSHPPKSEPQQQPGVTNDNGSQEQQAPPAGAGPENAPAHNQAENQAQSPTGQSAGPPGTVGQPAADGDAQAGVDAGTAPDPN